MISREDELEALLSSTLKLMPRATDESFVDAVMLAATEEERFRQSRQAFVRQRWIDVAALAACGGMFAALLQVVEVKKLFELQPLLLLTIAFAITALSAFLQPRSNIRPPVLA